MLKIKLIQRLRQKTSISLDLCIKALKKNKWSITNAIRYIKYNDGIKVDISNIDLMRSKVVVSDYSINKNILYITSNNNDFIIRDKLFINKSRQVKDNLINYIGDNIAKVLVLSIYKSLYLYMLIKETNDVIKEQMLIKNIQIFNSDRTERLYYIHGRYSKSIGKSTVFIGYDNNIKNKEYKNLLIHIIALNTTSIDINGLCKCILREHELLLYMKYNTQITTLLKAQKIVRERINNLFKKFILLEQKYLLENKLEIKNVVKMQKNNGINFIYYYSYNI